MKLKLSAKSIFIILIVLIITILTFNYINRNSQLNSQKIQDIDPSKEGKTVGVNIEQNQPNGEKIKIIADLMEENKKEKFIKLINPIAESFTKNKGNLPWPVERGAIIQKFGLQPHPVVRTTKIKSNGIVIATTKDANVRSVFEGVVLSILKFKGSNLTVLIKHGNYISAYKNLSKVFVEKGDNINALQIIGEAYTNINDNKTTLQFSIFNNTTPLDPYLWIAK